MRINEIILESIETPNDQRIVDRFVVWAVDYLKVKTPPEFEYSLQSSADSSRPHTGAFNYTDNKVWIYVKNRNIIDIIRTIAHELVHVKQNEMKMVSPEKSFPGSAIEVLADAIAGKMVKLYGKDHPEVYQ